MSNLSVDPPSLQLVITVCTVLKLSIFPLRNAHFNLLSKGPKFCPIAKGNNLNLKSDLREFTRKLKCPEKFWGIEF